MALPISSSEIAQLNGAYQSAAMSQMSYASSIGQGNVYGAPAQGSGYRGDRAMGGMMSGASAATPLAAGAMGLLGLDPMSIGLRAGASAFGAGAGFGGAALAGSAVAMPLMAAGAAVNHIGSQMYAGAGQQSHLNDTLRSSFSFRNQQGGQGFQRSEMSSVGSMVREMSEQFGPGGEITSFRELTGLAGKMGTMGFATGVRDVQDFTKRFKDMVGTLKTMAKDLGSTLEGAMEFAASAKGSGVFGNRVAGFTSAARQTAVSGGLALSEVTGAANIGSQISRSVGGLGRQGAMGGMRTIGQIGTAQQMGLLSEEDIYNVTGQTGAEGRQAYAANAMSGSARFLQSGKGRRMLASIAGKDGSLDEGSVQQLLNGGMGISDTMREDQKHLGKIGRANFIRNEGRLRGAALERLGGFMPALQLSQWAASKGIDINDMDDRSMVFAQRQLGMGRDEVDQAVKMANAMPAILEQQKRDARSDQHMQGVAEARKGRGVQGVEQRFNQARETINGKLQKLGQDLFNQGSEHIDSFVNKMLGEYVETYSKDIDDKYQTMMRGGRAGSKAGQRAFGIGGNGMSAQAMSMMKKSSGFGGGGEQDMATLLTQGSKGGFLDSLRTDIMTIGPGQGELSKWLLHGQSGVGKMKEAGFNLSGLNSQQMQEKLKSIDDIRRVAASSFDKSLTMQGHEGADWIREAYALGGVAGEGDDRIKSFGEVLKQKGGAALVKEWEGADQSKKALIMSNMERGAGIRGEGALAARYGVPSDVFGKLLGRGGKFGSVGEENKAWAQSFMGEDATSGEQGLARSALRAATGGLSELIKVGGKSLGARAGGKFDTDAREQEIGAFVKGKDFRNLAQDLLSGDKDVAKHARDTLGNELGALSDEDKAGGVASVKQEMLAGSSYANFLRENPNATAKQKADFAKGLGRSVEKLEGSIGAMASVVTEQQKRDRIEMSRRARGEGGQELDRLTNLGIYSRDKGGQVVADETKRAAAVKGGGAGAGKMFDDLTRLAVEQEDMKSRLGGTEGSMAADSALWEQIQARGDKIKNIVDSGTIAEKKALARQFAGSSLGDTIGASAAFEEKFNKTRTRRGATSAAADALGLSLSKDEKAQIGDISKGGDVGLLLTKAGVTDKELVKEAKGAKTPDELRKVIERASQDEGVHAKKQAEREKSAADRDPLQAKIAANTEKMAASLGKLEGLTASAIGEAVGAKVGKGNPEDKK